MTRGYHTSSTTHQLSFSEEPQAHQYLDRNSQYRVQKEGRMPLKDDQTWLREPQPHDDGHQLCTTDLNRL